MKISLFNSAVGLVVLIASGLTSLGIIGMYVRKGLKAGHSAYDKLDEMYDLLAGDDEIIDPDTGQVLKPATAPIRARVANLEQSWQPLLERMTAALERLADVEERHEALAAKVEDAIASSEADRHDIRERLKTHGI